MFVFALYMCVPVYVCVCVCVNMSECVCSILPVCPLHVCLPDRVFVQMDYLLCDSLPPFLCVCVCVCVRACVCVCDGHLLNKSVRDLTVCRDAVMLRC